MISPPEAQSYRFKPAINEYVAFDRLACSLHILVLFILYCFLYNIEC